MNYDNEQALLRLQKARMGLVQTSVFFTTLCLRLEMKVDPEAKHAFWTDGVTLGVHPIAALETPMPELEGTLARATLNSALGHPTRREHREAKMWSEAAGHVACLEVLAAGLKLPPGAPANPAYAGMTVEQVYAMMQSAAEQDPGTKGTNKNSSPSQGSPGQSGSPGPAPTTPAAGKPQGGTPSAPPTPANGSPGQPESADGTGGEPLPQSGEVRDAPGDEAATSSQDGTWQQAIAQATQLARAAGELPGGLERAAEKAVAARVSWREALQRYFKERAKDDSTWTKPNRRFMMDFGIYLPSLESVKMGPLVFAVDMSGSVGQKAIDQFFSEIDSARQECGPEYVLILPFDSEIREAFRFDGDEESVVKAKSGGGTDFRPAVEYLAREGITPEALVYLTDLDCTHFATEPEYPVLWVTTRKAFAPYGDVIEMLG